MLKRVARRGWRSDLRWMVAGGIISGIATAGLLTLMDSQGAFEGMPSSSLTRSVGSSARPRPQINILGNVYQLVTSDAPDYFSSEFDMEPFENMSPKRRMQYGLDHSCVPDSGESEAKQKAYWENRMRIEGILAEANEDLTNLTSQELYALGLRSPNAP